MKNVAVAKQLVLMIMVLAGLSALPTNVEAQYMYDIGTPTYTTMSPVEFGFVNIANGDLHLEIPVYSSPQRGASPFWAKMVYDSGFWHPVLSTSLKWQPTNVPNSQSGWRMVTSADVGAQAGYSQQTTICGNPPTGAYTIFSNFVWRAPDGTSHTFNFNTQVPGTCGVGDIPNGSGFASDSSGFKAFVSNYVTITAVYDRNGALVYPSHKDANGNLFSTDASGNVTDTLGRTAMTKTVNGATTTYAFPAASGGSSSFTMTTTTIDVSTNFQQPSAAEYSGTIPVVQSFGLPDGSSFTFDYDSGTTPGKYGMLKTMTLPTSGIVGYTYLNINDGNINRRVSGRTVTPAGGSPASWTYTTALVSGHWQVTVTKPTNDNEVYAFTTTAGNWNTQIDYYTGAIQPSNLLKTVNNTFDFSHTPGPYYVTQTAAVVTLPSGKKSRVEYVYDANNYLYGNVTQQKRWDFYTGSTPPTPDRKTTTAYLATSPYIGANILSLPSTVTETNGSGSIWLSQTNYTYDSTALITSGATGVASHDDTNFGSSRTVRGNVTKIDRLLASGASCPSVTCLESVLAYDITGQVRTLTDPNGTTTTLSYADNFYSDNGANPPAAYTPSQPTNAYLTQVTPPLSNNTLTLGYYFGNGGLAVATDANNASSYRHYLDPLNRTTATVDPLNFVTNTSYPSFTVSDRSLLFNGNSSVVNVRTTLDSLGRVNLQQRVQAPGQGNYDSVQTDYDSLSRPYRRSIPFVGTASQVNPSPVYTQTTYDGLSRPTLITDPGTGTTSFSYLSNDELQTLGPAPAGENTKQRQLEYDGFGRLASVCELTTAALSGTCGQATVRTGYWTKYVYSIGAGTQTTTVTQNAQLSAGSQQTRTYVYDALGRLKSETNPESGNVAYVFDSDGTCGSSAGDLVKRTDAMGNVTCYGYDSMHRRTSITHPSGPYSASTPTSIFVFDAATVNGVAMNNVKGQLAEAYTCTGACTSKITDLGFSYSLRKETTDIYESTPHSGGYYHLTAQYWPHGLTKSLSGLPSLPTITLGATDGSGLDGEGRLTKVNASSGQNPVTLVAYTNSGTTQPIGSLTQVTYGSADIDNFNYDPNTSRFTRYKFSVGTGPQVVQGDLNWSPNATLRSLTIADAINAANAQTCNYGYDDLARIASANCGTPWSQTFTPDPLGNLTKSGSLTFLPNYTSPPTNQYNQLPGGPVGVSNYYDANGNVINDLTHAYAWDAEGKMRSIDSTAVALTYDAFGRAAEQARGASYTQIVYSTGNRKLALMNGQTLSKAFVPLPGGGTAVYNASGLQYYRHPDWLGSSRVATTPTRTSYFDGSYAPYGEDYAKLGTNDLSFTGQNQDTIAGLYDFLYREYSPVQGRWLSPDPAGLTAVRPADPQTWNRYAYVANRPLNVVDPLGLDPQPPKPNCPPSDTQCWLDYFRAMQQWALSVQAKGSNSRSLFGGCQDFSCIRSDNAMGFNKFDAIIMTMIDKGSGSYYEQFYKGYNDMFTFQVTLNIYGFMTYTWGAGDPITVAGVPKDIGPGFGSTPKPPMNPLIIPDCGSKPGDTPCPNR